MISDSATPAGVRVIRCQTWDDFILAVRVRRSHARGPEVAVMFRGHADPSWQLASVWERFLIGKRERREAITGDEVRVRDRKLAAFKEHATGMPGVTRDGLQSDLEWWALGRHHGLVTPLLDWSRSPYPALFVKGPISVPVRRDPIATARSNGCQGEIKRGAPPKLKEMVGATDRHRELRQGEGTPTAKMRRERGINPCGRRGRARCDARRRGRGSTWADAARCGGPRRRRERPV